MIPVSEHSGRVAIITGGSGAIGGAIARRLLSQGAAVHLADVKPPQENGCEFHQIDVSSEAEVDGLFHAAARSTGHIDLLVCCAAVYRPRPFLELPLEEWRRTLNINLTGYFLCCRAALRFMRPQNFGRIVMFSSTIARTGGIHSADYAASKGGILGLARSLAIEEAPNDIRVNTISPGITDTPQPRAFLSDADFAARRLRIPLGRVGEVEDMVEACMFLLSDDSSYLIGQDLRVNGGASLW